MTGLKQDEIYRNPWSYSNPCLKDQAFTLAKVFSVVKNRMKTTHNKSKPENKVPVISTK